MDAILAGADLARFESKFQRGEANACWEWLAGCDQDGYGAFSVGPRGTSKGLRAHRIAYSVVYGPIPAGGHVLHRCNNPGCVNPGHLYLADNWANMQDRRNSGHYATGAANPATKLTPEQVREIRRLYRPGLYGYRRLAERFEVSFTTIQRILARTIWDHLPEEGESPPGPQPLGYSAKLTEADVQSIRAEYAAGTVSQSELGRRWRVTQATIWQIVRGRTWTQL